MGAGQCSKTGGCPSASDLCHGSGPDVDLKRVDCGVQAGEGPTPRPLFWLVDRASDLCARPRGRGRPAVRKVGPGQRTAG
ncbi:hypothetical protein NDU88_005987 [Pleurodeles waltl]|uniref:Uncharacterized protein n=1 Tax=Pleurodeles waltl TaxID=8319 RepID=A0AAV7WCM2_PLEWA|nr:hypothetical protein NDU88_005987 [Pleurodeles waltl]